MIPWRPIAELPDELKDGRMVLLWASSGHAFLGHWFGDWALDNMLPLSGITHFAEITPP